MEQTQIIEAFNVNNRPSLRASYLPSPKTNVRTFDIGECPIRVELITKLSWNISMKSEINLFFLQKEQSILEIDEILTNIWNDTGTLGFCILVHLDTSIEYNHYKIPRQIIQKWSIPYINISCQDQQSINNMLLFAIKYYWFRNVINK